MATAPRCGRRIERADAQGGGLDGDSGAAVLCVVPGGGWVWGGYVKCGVEEGRAGGLGQFVGSDLVLCRVFPGADRAGDCDVAGG